MKTPSEPSQTKEKTKSVPWGRDLIKLGFAAGALIGMMSLFFLTPTLATPTIAAFFMAMMLTPLVAQLERAGLSRTASVSTILTTLAAIAGIGAYTSYALFAEELASFKVNAPQYFAQALEMVRGFEASLRERSDLFNDIALSEKLEAWIEETRKWFVLNGATLVGNLATTVLIAPLIVFFLLNDGKSFRKVLFQLIPNRVFESVYIIVHRIGAGISDYIRAKLIEALFVGFLTFAGLLLVGAPYAIVLAIIAGVTNIVPYVGPVIGAIPAIVLIGFDPQSSSLLLPVMIVFLVANLIDFVLIFPVFVAKLVDLHPIFLLAAVAIGQEYYGLIGMLISIPVASALKVIFQELYHALYARGVRKTPSPLPVAQVVRRQPFSL